MVSNSKDDHPSKATPITHTVVSIHPTAIVEANLHLPPVGQREVNGTVIVASFPGLPQLQFLIALQAIKNWSQERPGIEATVMHALYIDK